MKTLIPTIAIIMAVAVGLINILDKEDAIVMNEKYYKGRMLGGYNFEMTLKRDGSSLSGSVLNTYNNITQVKGLMDESNNFMLREYEQERFSGIYKGIIFKDGEIKGVWSNPDGTRRLPFKMIQEVKTPPSRANHFTVGSLNPKKLILLLKGE